MNLVWKLLRSNLNMSQMSGFFFANLAGMLIVLLCLQVYADIRPLLSGNEGFIKKDFWVITKKLNTLGIFSGRANTFTPEEVAEIKRQPFVKNAGLFTSSAYGVSAGIRLNNAGFSTEMFFESIPDEYIDVNLDEWRFDDKEGLIPVIIPRNYLNLYNFGFAQSRSLPKLSESAVGNVRFDVTIRGNRSQAEYKGRIVGFSNRINTILVPQHFMQWANATFAPEKTPHPSRIIVEIENPGNRELAEFFKTKAYDVEGEKQDSGQTVWFLNLLTTGILSVGLLICILSVYILMLSIYLILQKNSTKLENLLLLGYRVNDLARPYRRFTLILSGTVLLIALLAVLFLRSYYLPVLNGIWQGGQEGGIWLTLSVGVGIVALIFAWNTIIIQYKIGKLLK